MKQFSEANSLHRVTLEKLQFGLRDVMSPALISDLRLHEEYDHILMRSVVRITGYVFSKEVRLEEFSETPRVEYHIVPKTWWDAFKLALIPGLSRRRRWIRWRRLPAGVHNHHHLKFYKTCPHLNIKTPERDTQIHLDFLTTDDFSE